MSGVLMTGYPGFIAGRLFDRLVADRPADTKWFVLVEPRFTFVAREKLAEAEERHPQLAGNWHVVPGDITKPDLGMARVAYDAVRKDVDEVWHLAAVYDLAVPEPIARKVNVVGTENVLDLCERLPRLKALNYISTCYVAGDRTGRVYEDDLEAGQGFKNHYESTKHHAEVAVRRRMDRIPTRIFRPAIVVGDSETGETVKGDGPYFVMQLLFRLPKLLPMVYIGEMKAKVTLAPVDFIVDAMALLSKDETALGKTFHLADPDPPTSAQVLEEMCRITGRAGIVGRVPRGLGDALASRRRIRKALGLPAEILDYFNHPVEFDTTNTAEHLANVRPPCPRLFDYLPTLAEYAQNHPQIFQEVA